MYIVKWSFIKDINIATCGKLSYGCINKQLLNHNELFLVYVTWAVELLMKDRREKMVSNH